MPLPTILTTTSISIDSVLDTSSTNAVQNGAVASALNGKSDVTAIVTDNTATPALTLANNTITRCSNASITTLTISGVATGFEYASVTFSSPSTAAAFAMPATGWYAVGADCSSGVFTPVTDMRYNLAIMDEGDRIAVYVMEAM